MYMLQVPAVYLYDRESVACSWWESCWLVIVHVDIGMLECGSALYCCSTYNIYSDKGNSEAVLIEPESHAKQVGFDQG